MQLKNRIKNFIDENKDANKACFDEGLITSSYEIKGLPMAKMNEQAKILAQEKVEVKDMPLSCHEEILLAGMVLGLSKISTKAKVERLKYLLPYIDNWATCDMIVTRLKGLESEKDFFISLLSDKRPFYIRFGIVYLMKFQLKQDIRGTVTLLNERVKNTNYYVEMALAWCYAEAAIKDFDFMLDFTQKLERYIVRNRTLQKICESYRVSDEQKKIVRKLRSQLLGMEI